MGDSYAWPDNFAWKPHAWLSPLLKLNRYVLTYATHKVSNPWGTQSVHRDPFGWCNRLPMCSFLWGTAMHGRTPVHGTPMCRCPPFRNTKNRWKLMLNTWLTTRGACSLPIYMHLKGGTNFGYVVSHGGQLCMAGQLCMEAQCMVVPPIETQ